MIKRYIMFDCLATPPGFEPGQTRIKTERTTSYAKGL